MKTKIIFTTLFIFVLINLACVCAADNQANDNNGVFKEPKYEDVVINEDNLCGSSLASLGMNIELLSDDSGYVLTKDYAYNPTTDSGNIKQGLKINKDNFVIDGKGHTIDGGQQSRIFSITGKNVTIKNLNIINANSLVRDINHDIGGAIGFQTPGSVDNCTFSKCSTRFHGALFLAKCGNVTNSIFTNNRAGEFGGGLYIEGGIVDNCTFIENSVGNVVCGALCARGDVLINNSIFHKNVGAIGAITGTGNLIVENCNFFNNMVIFPGIPSDITLITKGTDLHFTEWDLIENSTLTINELHYIYSDSPSRFNDPIKDKNIG